MDEIPEGLEDLLNEIRGGGTATAAIPTPIKEREEKLVEEDIDPRIIEILGIGDTKDITYGTYKTLLKEKMVAGRMADSQIPTEEAELLTDEFKRVKGKKGRFKVKGQRVDFDKFMGKAAQKTASPQKRGSALALRTAAPGVSSNNLRTEKEEEDPTVAIIPLVTDLKENMQSILDTLEKQYKIGQKEEREEDKLEAQSKRKEREEDLESKGVKKTDDSKAKKVVKPVKGIFDMLMDFFKNILLGGALLWLLNFLKDPAKVLQPFVDVLNNILSFFNGIIDAVNRFINGINEFVFGPINDFLIKPFHTALNFVEDRINDVLNLFGQDPLENIPDESPEIKIPFIPKIPPYDPFEILPEAERVAPPPIEGMKDGGIVLNNSNSFGDVNVQAMTEGGKVTGSTGTKIGGMGVDTQLTALQPGEVVMSKSAVQRYGADNLLAMNKAGGGSNMPSFGGFPGFSGGGITIPSFSGGGLVGGTPGTPRNPKKRKIYLHWSGGAHSGTRGMPYHQTFNGAGKPGDSFANYGVDKFEHTAAANTDSVALGAAAMGHGPPDKPYSDARGWKENPLTSAQTTAMAKEAAGLLKAYGQTAADVNKNVRTHGEWEREAVKTGKLSPPVQRWDLDSLTPGPYNHPGGFYSTQQILSKGGNQMRAKIKSFMTGGSGEVEAPKFTSAEGVSSTNFGVFQAMSEGQQSRILQAEIGTKIEGVTVTERLKSELTKFQVARTSHAKKIELNQSVQQGGPATATVTQSTVSTTPQQRNLPPMSDEEITRTLGGSVPSQIAPGATPQSSAAGGMNNSIPTFDTIDSMNTEILVIKSMYNLIN